MSWAVTVRKISHIKPIEGADAIEVAYIGEWPCVVKKGEWAVGDTAVYVPVDSIVPETLLESIGLKGRLSGAGKNRVKAVRLRGQVSIGILLKAPAGVEEGSDVAAHFGITKYEQEIPVNMAGRQRQHPRQFIIFDVENINNEPDWLQEGEEVVCTEKLHGTSCSFALVDGEFFVSSRKVTLIEEPGNLYWQVARADGIEDKIRKLHQLFNLSPEQTLWIHGEIVPCQDLKYGLVTPTAYAFDIRVDNDYVDYWKFADGCNAIDLKVCPLLYKGPFSLSKIKELTNGKETLNGAHIREGLVVKPVIERRVGKNYSRCILKSVSQAYLLRKDGSELH